MPSSFAFRFDGLEELKDALKMLPDELVDEATSIIRFQSLAAAGAIRAGYARKIKGQARSTGKLMAGVVVEATDSGRYGVKYVVLNKARHAHLFEWGTEARHSDTHDTLGRMPPGNVFVPEMEKARRKMWEEIGWMMARHHLEVTGSAA